MIRPWILVTLVATLLVPLCRQVAGSDSKEPPTNAEQTDKIAAIYKEKCERCHGKHGEGVADGYEESLDFSKSLDQLTKLIDETMPEEDPESCTGTEAKQLAEYIRNQLSVQSSKQTSPTISRLTVSQYRNAIADVIGHFTSTPQEDSPRSRYRSRSREVPGLRGEYFQSSGMNKASQLGHYRSDTHMEFDFGDDAPVPSISPEQFAIIWQGSLRADHTGEYRFRVTTENGARLYLNFDPQPDPGSLRDDRSIPGQSALIDDWVGSGELRHKEARTFLLGGRSYPIRLEFFKYLEEGAQVKLEWKPPHGTWSVLDYNHTTTESSRRIFVCDVPFPADDRSLGYERGSSASEQWQTSTMHGAVQAAAEVVARLPLLAQLDEGDSDEERQQKVRAFISELATVAYRRPLREDESSRLDQIVNSAPQELEAGVRRAVVLVFLSPQFLYPGIVAPEKSTLPYAVASKLSFGIWDSIPDQDLIDAAVGGRLKSTDEIESYTRRMLRDPRAKAKLRGFFNHWLEIEERDLSKDNAMYPEFNDAVVADLRRSLELFIDEVVWSRDSDYRELLLADHILLNDRLAALYQPKPEKEIGQLDGEEIKRRARRRRFGSDFQPVDFDSKQRSGILTHPYLLSAFAYHNNTSPIHRGVFLTRNIVGRALSPPPMAIAFKDDEFSPDLTMREKVTQLTRDTACMSCHSVINPLGFTLENFDAVGRYRKTDNQKPVDTTSQYKTESGKTLSLTSARDVAEFAAKNPAAHRAFVAHLFEHLVKQSAHEAGEGVIDELTKHFVDDQFNIQKLCAKIVAVTATINETKYEPRIAENSK